MIPCFGPGFAPFRLDAPYKFTPLVSLCSLIFGLTPFGWLINLYLSTFYGDIIFYLRLSDLLQLFQKRNWGFKEALRALDFGSA
jgi:hypothetical protein